MDIVLNIVDCLNHYLRRLAIVRHLMRQLGLPIVRNIVCVVLFVNTYAWSQEASDEGSSNAMPNNEASQKEREPTIDDSTPTSRFQPDINQKQYALITQAFSEEYVKKFQLSGELVSLTANNKAFLGVWESSKNGTPLGAVLLLHGEGQTLDYPDVIGKIRSSLPHHGWATLSVSVDPAPQKIVPARVFKSEQVEAPTNDKEEKQDQSEDNNSESVQAEPISSADTSPADRVSQAQTNMMSVADLIQKQDDAYMQDVLARLKAGLDFLNEKGQFNIALIAHGTGAIYIKELANQAQNTSADRGENISTTIRALIFINARNSSFSGAHNIETLFNKEDVPTLDAYFDNHMLDQVEPPLRLDAAKQSKRKNYYQIKLNQPASTWHKEENQLTRRVRGFLNRFAKGVEVEG